jgi:hypothetical protein
MGDVVMGTVAWVYVVRGSVFAIEYTLIAMGPCGGCGGVDIARRMLCIVLKLVYL